MANQFIKVNGKFVHVKKLIAAKKAEQAALAEEVEVTIEVDASEETKEEEVVLDEIEFVRREYEKKFDKKVPNNKKNDLEWLKAKLVG